MRLEEEKIEVRRQKDASSIVSLGGGNIDTGDDVNSVV
jgi:hypothetical protein